MKEKNLKLDRGLLIQLFMVLVLIVMLVLAIFWGFLFTFAEILAGITLIVMGYNNQRIYKRKILTYIYIAFGILVTISGIWSIF